MTTPASHQSDSDTLPHVPVKVIDLLLGADNRTSLLNDALHAWLNDASSNLLVLMGAFGSGKTYGLTSFQASTNSLVQKFNFDEVATSDPKDSVAKAQPEARIIVFDNFDGVNSLAPNQVDDPDLRHVSHLSANHRVILATRRLPIQAGDELLGQMRSEQRLSQLGFKRPWTLHLQPWDMPTLQDHLSSMGAEDSHYGVVLSYLCSLSSDESEHLRRPLLIKMLLRLAKKRSRLDSGLTLSSLYTDYCALALASDYDQGRSQISGSVKAAILASLAYDIFSGVSRLEDERLPPLALQIDRVTGRVMEGLMAARALRSRPGFDLHDWTEDFLSTNHIFEDVTPPKLQEFSGRKYGFVDSSVYEYFVGLALCQRIANGQAFGLDVHRFSPATVDSLALAFVKELGGKDLRDALITIVRRPRLGTIDRLVLLYFLEDDTEFLSLLGSMPPEYLGQLEKLAKSISSFFLRKMILYQLVVVGLYRAEDYVAEIQRNEDELGLRAEIRLHSAHNAATLQLLKRFENPALERARPITIYRLRQVGDASAIEPLEAAALAEPAIAELVREAISEIKARTRE